MRTNPPAATTLLRDERKQIEDSLSNEFYNDSLDEYEDETEEDSYAEEAAA